MTTKTKVDETNVTQEDLAGFLKDNRDLVLGAVQIGWRLRLTGGNRGGQSALLTAPDGKTLRVGSRKKPVNPGIAQLKRIVIKHADPMRLASAEAMVTSPHYRWSSVQANAAQAAAQAQQNGHTEPSREESQPAPEPQPEPVQEPKQEAPEEPYIVEIRPFMCLLYPNKHGGMRYESDTTLERVWSDGHIDYKCKRCPYARPKMRSVAMHHRKHGGEHKGWKDKDNWHQADDYTHTASPGTRPRHPDEIGEVESEIAAVEQELDQIEEIDPAEQVRRIRDVLGADPELARLRAEVAELRQEVSDVTAELKSAQEESAREKVRADDLHGSLNALRDLIAGIES